MAHQNEKKAGLPPGLWCTSLCIFCKGTCMQFNYKHISFSLHPMVAILIMSPALPWF